MSLQRLKLALIFTTLSIGFMLTQNCSNRFLPTSKLLSESQSDDSLILSEQNQESNQEPTGGSDGDSKTDTTNQTPPGTDNLISKVEGKNQYIINGNFSAKRANPLVFLNGTESNIGDTVPGLELGTHNYHIDNKQSYSGTASLFADAHADSNGAYDRFIFDTPQSEIYYSYLTYIDAIAYGAPSIGPQFKLGRIGMDLDSHTGWHSFGAVWFIPDRLDIFLSGHPAQFGAKKPNGYHWDAKKLIKTWIRHEGYVKILKVESEVLRAAASYRMYTATGEVVHRYRGWPIYSFNAPDIPSESAYYDNRVISDKHVLKRSPEAPTKYVHFILPFYKRKTTDLDIWVDDVYINTSPERVELCNEPLWESCNHRVLQNTILRTATSLRFDFNPGHLSTSGPLYIYVFDKDGSNNKNGILLPR